MTPFPQNHTGQVRVAQQSSSTSEVKGRKGSLAAKKHTVHRHLTYPKTAGGGGWGKGLLTLLPI